MSPWPETTLGEVLAEAAPGFACGDDVVDGVFQLRMNNITTEGQLDLGKRRRVPRNYRNIERFLLHPGDVLFNATNSPDLVGKAAYFPGLNEPAVFSNHFLRLRPRVDQIDGRFLTRWLNLQFQLGRFKSMCRQWVNQATVSRDSLLSLKLPLPPLPEQRRIAAILDQADALQAKRRAALKKLDELTQSIFLDMFGDPATNPKGWPRILLGCLVKDVPTWNPLNRPDDIFRYIDIAAIDQSRKQIVGDREVIGREAPSRARQLVKTGDVLVSTVRPNLNAVALVPSRLDGATASTGFCVLRPRDGELSSEYLFALVRTQFFIDTMTRQATGASYPAVTDAIVKSWRAPKPPYALQMEYSRRVAGLEAVRHEQERALRSSEELFVSLQHHAFLGEL